MTQFEAYEIARAIGRYGINARHCGELCEALNETDLPFFWIPGYIYGEDEASQRVALDRRILVVERCEGEGCVIQTFIKQDPTA